MKRKLNPDVFNKFPELESERLYLREFRKNDIKDLYELRSDRKITEAMDTYRIDNLHDARLLLESVIESYKNKKSLTWAIIEKKSGKFIGYFTLYRFINEESGAEISYALKKEFHGDGFMSEVFCLLLPFVFNEMNLNFVEADVNPNNKKSINLLKKYRFKRENSFTDNSYFKSLFFNTDIFILRDIDFNKTDINYKEIHHFL